MDFLGRISQASIEDKIFIINESIRKRCMKEIDFSKGKVLKFDDFYAFLEEIPQGLNDVDKKLIEWSFQSALALMHTKPPAFAVSPIETSEGPIFRMKQYNFLDGDIIPDVVKQAHDVFLRMRDLIKNLQGNLKYYSIPPWYYTGSSLDILERKASTRDLMLLLHPFFGQIEEISRQPANYATLTFIVKSYMTAIGAANFSSHDFVYALLSSMKSLFSSPSQPPSCILSMMFQPWYYISRKCISNDKRLKDLCNESIDFVADLFAKVTKLKYNDLQAHFNWRITLSFYRELITDEQKNKVLMAICYAMRNAVDFEQEIRNIEQRKAFHEFLSNEYVSGKKWELLTMISFILNTLNRLSYKLSKFRSIEQASTEIIIKGYISTPFFDQTDYNGKYESFDKVLITKRLAYCPKTEEQYIRGVEKEVSKLEDIKKRMMSAMIFFDQTATYFLNNINKKDSSIVRTYVQMMASSFINLMISVSYSHMIVYKFIFASNFNYDMFSYSQNTLFSKCMKMRDIHQFFIVFLTQFNNIPKVFFLDFIREVENQIFIASKNRKLTLNFINLFSSIIEGHEDFITVLLQKMIERIPLLVKDIFSVDATKTDDVVQWIVFIMRLAFEMKLLKKTSKVYLSLITQSKVITTALVAHIRRFSSGVQIWNIIDLFIEMYNIVNRKSSAITKPKLLVIKPRQPLFNDTKKMAWLRTFPNLLHFLTSPHIIPRPQLYLQIIEYAYQTDDKNTFDSASKFISLLLDLAKKEFKEKTDDLAIIPKNWFINASYADQETIIKMLESVDIFGKEYIKASNNAESKEPFFRYGNYNFNMYSIIDSITDLTKISEVEMFNVIILLRYCFDSILTTKHESEIEVKAILNKLFVAFNSCFAYQNLRDDANELKQHLIITISEKFSNNHVYTVLISLFETIGMFAIEMFLPLIDFTKELLKYISNQGENRVCTDIIVEKICHMGNPKYMQFTFLTAFSLIIQIYPDDIKLVHIKILLTSIKNINIFDEYTPSLFTTFIEKFLDYQNDEVKREFAEMIYNSNVETTLRPILCLAILDHNITISVKPNSDFMDCDMSLFFHRFCIAAFAKAIGSTNDELVARVSEIFKHNDNSNYDKSVKIILLVYAVVVNPVFYSSFASNIPLISNIMSSIANNMNAKFKIIINLVNRALLEIINSKITNKKINQQLEETIRSPVLSFSEKYVDDRIAFSLRRKIKLFPECITPGYIQALFNTVIDFSLKSPDVMLQKANVYRQVVKTLGVKTLVSQEKFRETILSSSKGGNILKEFIDAVIKIYITQNISIIQLCLRSLISIFNAFNEEVIDIVLFSNDIPTGNSFMRYIMENDKSNTLFKTLIKRLDVTPDYSKVRSPVFRIVRSLTEEKEEVCDQQCLEVSKKIFMFFFNINKGFNNYIVDSQNSLNEISFALINILKVIPDSRAIVMLSSIFSLPFFFKSDLLVCFKDNLLAKLPRNAVTELFTIIVEDFFRLTPSEYGILLPNVTRLMKNEDTDVIWNTLITLFDDTERQYVVLNSMKVLMKFSFPPHEILTEIITKCCNALKSKNPTVVMYAMKLMNAFALKNALPRPVFNAFFKQVFHFHKFLDVPYIKITSSIFSNCKEYVDSLPNDCIEALLFYTHDHLNTPNELQRFGGFLLHVPNIDKYLQFPFITIIGFAINRCINKCQNKELIKYFRILNSILNSKHVDKEEIKPITECAITILMNMKSNQQHLDVVSPFAGLVLENGFPGVIPDNFLDGLNEMNQMVFVYISLAMKYSPLKTAQTKKALVEEALKLNEAEDNKLYPYYKSLVESTFSSEEVFNLFKPTLYTIFNESINMYKEDSSKKALLLIKCFIGCSYPNVATYAIDTVMEARDIAQNCDEYFSMMINSLENIIPTEQKQCGDVIMEISSSTKKSMKVFIENVPKIIQSPKVAPIVKNTLIEYLAMHITDSNIFSIRSILNSIESYSKTTTYDLRVPLFHLVIKAASTEEFKFRILYFKAMKSLLPEDQKEAVIELFTILNPDIWEDKYLASIIAVLTPIQEEWYPLFSLTPILTRCASEMLESIILDVLEPSNASIFLSLLVKILALEDKKKHILIMKTLLRSFFEKKINIPYKIAEKVVKYTNDIQILPFFFDKDACTSSHLVKPSVLNDSYFAFIGENLSLQEKAGTALMLLSMYESSNMVFSNNTPTNPYIGAITELSKRYSVPFVSKGFNVEELQVFKKAELVADQTMELIEKALNTTGRINTGIANKLRLFLSNTLYSHRYVSSFEKERVVIVSSIVNLLIQGSESKMIDFGTLINPSLKQAYEDLCFYIRGEVFNDIKIINEDAVLFMQKSYAKDLPSIAGYTGCGLVAVGTTNITEYFGKISNSIMQNTMTSKEWFNFGCFAFELFLVQPETDFFQSAYNSLGRVLNASMDASDKLAACGHIITMMKIADKTRDSYYIDTVKRNYLVFDGYYQSIEKFWIHSFISLCSNDWFVNVSNKVFMNISCSALPILKRMGRNDLYDYVSKHCVDYASFQKINSLDNIIRYLNIISSFGPQNIEDFQKLRQFVLEVKYCQPSSEEEEEEYNKLMQDIKFVAIKNRYLAKVSDVQGFVQTCKTIDIVDVDKFVREFFNVDFSEEKERIFIEYVESINNQLVFELIDNIEDKHNIIFHFFRPQIVSTLPIGFIIQASTNVDQFLDILVINSKSYEYEKQLEAMSFFTIAVNNIMNDSYNTRTRNMKYPYMQYFDIGEGFYLMPLYKYNHSYIEIFEHLTNMNPFDYINSPQEPVEVNGESIFHLFCKQTDTRSFCHCRERMIRNYSISAALFTICGNSYQDPLNMILHDDTISNFVFPVDFNERKEEEPPFRLTPVLTTIFGDLFKEKFIVSFSSAVGAFIEHMELFRASVQIPISLNHEEIFVDTDLLLDARSALENRASQLAPPVVESSSCEDCVEWYSRVSNIIDASINTESYPLPREKIPWL